LTPRPVCAASEAIFFQVLNAVLKIAGSAIKKDTSAYKKIARVATINATTTTLKAIEVISHLSQPASEAALTAA
jgi:hypothetical protein